MVNVTKDDFDEDDIVKFQELLLDALYKGCPDFTKLSTIVKLLNLKGKYGASKKFFTELLGLIKKMQPVDSQAWRTIDEKFLKIVKDPRNLRLRISADGFDVSTGNRHHSVWSVLTVIYNLPLLFWVDKYDFSIKDNFNQRTIVLWTINDYPVLDALCGCPYIRLKGCVVCGKDKNYVRLSAASKQNYVGHRQYLPYNNPFKKQKKAFNGQQEFLLALIPMTTEQIYNEVQHIENKWGKGKRTNNKASKKQEDMRGRGGKIQKQKRNTTEEEDSLSQVNRQNGAYWKKFNIWNRKLRTLLHVPVKTKDKVNARLDVAELGVKPEQFAMQEEDKTTLPPAEGCIAEETIAEETIEFFSEYHKSLETIGIPPDKRETDENEEGKLLLASKSSEVSAKLFQKAHLYVIHNT
nr:hypothetical protein [Tanacetum cinerariifolium]